MCIHTIIILPHEHEWQSICFLSLRLFVTVLKLMAGLSNSHAQQDPTLIADSALSRQQELLQYSADPANNTYHDNDSDSLTMDTLYNLGVSDNCRDDELPCIKFRFIYCMIEGLISVNANVGKGILTPYKPTDVFFMTLAMLKNGSQ